MERSKKSYNLSRRSYQHHQPYKVESTNYRQFESPTRQKILQRRSKALEQKKQKEAYKRKIETLMVQRDELWAIHDPSLLLKAQFFNFKGCKKNLRLQGFRKHYFSFFNHLPDELKVEILLFLSFKDLEALSLVNKECYRLVNCPTILKQFWPLKYNLTRVSQQVSLASVLTDETTPLTTRLVTVEKTISYYQRYFEKKYPNILKNLIDYPSKEKEAFLEQKIAGYRNALSMVMHRIAQNLWEVLKISYTEDNIYQATLKILWQWYRWSSKHHYQSGLRIAEDFLDIICIPQLNKSLKVFAFQSMERWYQFAYRSKEKFPYEDNPNVRVSKWDIANGYWRVVINKSLPMEMRQQALDHITHWYYHKGFNPRSALENILEQYISYVGGVKLEKILLNKIYDQIRRYADIKPEYFNKLRDIKREDRIYKQLWAILVKYCNDVLHESDEYFKVPACLQVFNDPHISLSVKEKFCEALSCECHQKDLSGIEIINFVKILKSFLPHTTKKESLFEEKLSKLIKDQCRKLYQSNDHCLFPLSTPEELQFLLEEDYPLSFRTEVLQTFKEYLASISQYDLSSQYYFYPLLGNSIGFHRDLFEIMKKGYGYAYKARKMNAFKIAKNYKYLLFKLEDPYIKDFSYLEMEKWHRWSYKKEEKTARKIAETYLKIIKSHEIDLSLRRRALKTLEFWYGRAYEDSEYSAPTINLKDLNRQAKLINKPSLLKSKGLAFRSTPFHPLDILDVPHFSSLSLGLSFLPFGGSIVGSTLSFTALNMEDTLSDFNTKLSDFNTKNHFLPLKPPPPIGRARPNPHSLEHLKRQVRELGTTNRHISDWVPLAVSLLAVACDNAYPSQKRHKALLLTRMVCKKINETPEKEISKDHSFLLINVVRLCLQVAYEAEIKIQQRKQFLQDAWKINNHYHLFKNAKHFAADSLIPHQDREEYTEFLFQVGYYLSQPSTTLNLGLKKLKQALKYADCCFEAAESGIGENVYKAQQERRSLEWIHSWEGSDNIEELGQWVKRNYSSSYWYELGKLYLNHNPEIAKHYLKKEAKNSESSFQTAAAYQLGLLYALQGVSGLSSQTKMYHWFMRGDRWIKKRSSQQEFGLKLINDWRTKASNDSPSSNKYTYVLRELQQTRKLFGASADDKLFNIPHLQERAEDYRRTVILPAQFSHKSDMVYKPCQCVVIGGGLSGVLSAIQLARLHDRFGQPLFKVTLLEAQPHLMSGASAIPARLHCGGEYPLDKITALDCLHSSLLFWQMIPYGYTDIPVVTYLVHKLTENPTNLKSAEKPLTTKKMVKRYQILQGYYKRYYDHLNNGLTSGSEPLFGLPEDFFRELDQQELESLDLHQNFAGGIVTHEKGLNPAVLAAYLIHQLKEVGVDIQCNTAVKEAQPKPYGYKLYTSSNKYKAGLVINAAFENTAGLDQSISSQTDTTLNEEPLNVFLRGMAVVDISDCKDHLPKVEKKINLTENEKGKEKESTQPKEKEKTALFGLLRKNGGMFSPFNDNIAWCFWPSKKGSYIKWDGPLRLVQNSKWFSDDSQRQTPSVQKIVSFTVTGNEAIDEIKWDYLKDKERYLLEHPEERLKRAQAILDNLKTKYPFLEKAKAVDLIVRRIISPVKQTQRQHNLVRTMGRGGSWLRAISLKATFAPMTALQVVRLALEHIKDKGVEEKYWHADVQSAKQYWLDYVYHWMEDWQTPPEEVYNGINLPSIFRLSPEIDEQKLYNKAKKWAKQQNLPLELLEMRRDIDKVNLEKINE